MGYAKYIPLEDIVATCEQLYAANGFVKWADVGKIHEMSRQGVLNRLQNAADRGDLAPDLLDRWRSVSSRRAHARESREASREQNKRYLRVLVTEENKRWLDTESVLHKASYADLINGLINKAREAQK